VEKREEFLVEGCRCLGSLPSRRSAPPPSTPGPERERERPDLHWGWGRSPQPPPFVLGVRSGWARGRHPQPPPVGTPTREGRSGDHETTVQTDEPTVETNERPPPGIPDDRSSTPPPSPPPGRIEKHVLVDTSPTLRRTKERRCERVEDARIGRTRRNRCTTFTDASDGA